MLQSHNLYSALLLYQFHTTDNMQRKTRYRCRIPRTDSFWTCLFTVIHLVHWVKHNCNYLNCVLLWAIRKINLMADGEGSQTRLMHTIPQQHLQSALSKKTLKAFAEVQWLLQLEGGIPGISNKKFMKCFLYSRQHWPLKKFKCMAYDSISTN